MILLKKPTGTIDFKDVEKLFTDLKSKSGTKTSDLPFGIEQYMPSGDFESRPGAHCFSLKAEPDSDMSRSTSIETLFESLGFSEAPTAAASSKPLPEEYEDIIARTLVKFGISGEGMLYENGKIDMAHKDGSKIPLEDLMQGTDDHLDEPDVPKPFSYDAALDS